MGQSDFITYWTFHLMIVALNVQPCVILCGMHFKPHPTQQEKDDGHEKFNKLEKCIFILCCLQSFALLTGLFISSRSRKYSIFAKCCNGSKMPIIKRNFVFVSQIIIPVFILSLCCFYMWKFVPQDEKIDAFRSGVKIFFVMNC